MVTIQVSAFHGHLMRSVTSDPPPGGRSKKTLTFNLSNRTEVLLKSVIKFGVGDGLKVTGINSSSRGGKATFTHTRVIS